jgi:hypothetical protein
MVRTKTFLVFAFHPEAFVMEAIAQRIKKTSGARSRHRTARCAGVAHQSSSRPRGLCYTKRRSLLGPANVDLHERNLRSSVTRNMRTTLILALLLLSNQFVQADSIPEIVERTKSAIVEIVSMDTQGPPQKARDWLFCLFRWFGCNKFSCHSKRGLVGRCKQ